MIRKFKKFTRLPREEKRLFLEAWFRLGLMRAAILTLPFKRLTRGLEQRTGEAAPPRMDEAQSRLAEKIGRSVVRAAGHTPWESACLVQALTAQRMLKRRGIPGHFCLGVAKNGEQMDAHAWTRCGESILTGGRGSESFTVVSVFRWR